MEAVTLTLALILLAVVFLWIYNSHQKHHFFKRHGIPGPDPTPLVGNLYQIKASGNPNDMLDKWILKYGNVFGYYKGTIPYMVINNIDVIKDIMVKYFHLFSNRVPFVIDVEPLSYSLVNSKGQHWKDVRRILTPAFSAAKMKLMLDTMNRNADRMVEVMGGFSGHDFDISVLVQALTLDVIGSCALAMDVRSQGNPKDELFVAVRDFFRYAQNMVVDMALFLPFLKPIFLFINNYLTAGKMTDTILANLKNVIRLRRSDASQKRVDMLQLMMDAVETEGQQKGISDRDIIANAHVFMLAGYETTATALSFTMYLLARHQDVQERLFHEINDTLGSKDHPSYDEISEMKYLDQVLQESMRLYPPVTNFITRVCQEDVTIHGVFIPEGAIVEVPVWYIHHDKTLWPNPWRFDPDRFSPENKAHLGPFLAFGLGTRNCIGMRFAQLEAKIALVQTLRKFRLEPSGKNLDPLPLVCPIVITSPKEGPYLRAVSR